MHFEKDISEEFYGGSACSQRGADMGGDRGAG
jgi:hypothetical protein